MTATMPSAIERRPFVGLTASALAAAVAGCRRGDDRAYARGNTLIAGVDINDKGALNPDELVSTLVFLPLVRTDKHGDRQGCLATSWEHSSDYLEWTYRLRPGVRWHDGRPVTADDVKCTIDAWAHESSLAGTGCTVHDASTVTVRGRSWGKAGWDEYLMILPNHLVRGLDSADPTPNSQAIYNWDFWLRPVGNGPYRFVRIQPQTMVELEANPDYYKGKPRIARVVLKFTRGAGLNELLSGNVDTIQMGTTQLPVIANDSRFQTYWESSAGTNRILAIVWQNQHPLFREPDVRRALSLAVNRRELAQVLNLPRQSSLVDGLYTRRQQQRGEAVEPRFDGAEAGRLLDAAGWSQRNRHGVRERGGQEFRFTALTPAGEWAKAALYVQDQLRGLGVRMELQILNFSILRRRLKARDFAAVVCRLNYVWGHFALQNGGDYPLGFRHPRLTKWLDIADNTGDPEMLDEAYRHITDILRADPPVAFLTRLDRAYVAHRRVKGLGAPWHANPLMFTEDLWLDDRGGG